MLYLVLLDYETGLTRSELEYLADPKVSKLKVSRRDMAFCLSQVCGYINYNLITINNQGLNGGTTVSSTMICSHTAGIPIFITGGIGGVHRGGHNSQLKQFNGLTHIIPTLKELNGLAHIISRLT